MRTAALTLLCFVAFGYAMNAQRFSLLPQVGFESSRTKISYNDLSSFSPANAQFVPQASLRLNYASKQGHGFFFGAATSRSSIVYSFADPENGMTNFNTTAGDMQVQLEGGYQFSSKPISLNKSKQAAAKTKTESSSSYSKKSHCQKSYSSNSCSKSSNKSKPSTAAKNKGSWVRIQPSIGMAYIPGTETGIVTKTQNNQTTYEYRAGNWNTGFIAGSSFEFGNNKARLFTVSINYFKGLGNLDEQTLTTSDGVKSVTTTMQSAVSGWNMRIGIPFSLSKSSAAKSKTEKKATERKTNCQQYRVIRYRCGMN
ncbi:MAG TPA: hypothetical protein VIZ28_18640 [Chitinophagaceae bacterium]